MATPPPCSFAGYVSEAGTRLIQEWYDGLPEEEREELQDTLNYLSNIPVTSWKRPEFDKVAAPLHEVRCKANKKNHIIRVYGVFDSKVRGRFVFLAVNVSKKTKKDADTQALALKRWSLVNQGKASTHEFVIET